MVLVLIALFAAGLLAQTPEPPVNAVAPVGIVRGSLLGWDADGPSGEIRLRTTEETVVRLIVDGRTFLDRDRQRISITDLRRGDFVEVLSDRTWTEGQRFARIVHIVERAPAGGVAIPAGRRFRTYQSPTEDIVPRGNLTYTGMILQIAEHSMVLRTRIDGEKLILIRPDTRFLDRGSVASVSDLRTNTRVFVRAGRNFEDGIEAYQVVWGDILRPSRE